MDDAPAGVGAGVGVGVGNGGGGGGGGGVVSDMESQGTANVWKAATMKDTYYTLLQYMYPQEPGHQEARDWINILIYSI